jgi:flavin reductase (DIM6/NTAB) family NADH-FMN oxidoreductase RutF
MTANAFCSVSIVPPLVSIAADNESTWHKKVTNSGWYGVSVLSVEQGDLSNQFAGKPQSGLHVPFIWWDGIPVLDGAIVKLVCRVVDSHPAGDHTLHIGRVEHLDYEEGGEPLLFYTGAYNKLEVDIWETSFWW